MVPGQEANGNNLEKSFRSSIKEWYVECTYLNRLDGAILMSTHNLQHHKIRNFPEIFVFWSDRSNFVGTRKRVRISHGK